MNAIRPSELQQWLQQCQTHSPEQLPLVLDVREPWELQTASVKPEGFALLAMPMRTVPARLQELNPAQPMACLCHHGVRSAQVVHFLGQQGFGQVVNISGGIAAWSAEHDPTVPTY